MKIRRENRTLFCTEIGPPGEQYSDLQVVVRYAGEGSAYKGISLDHGVLPLLEASADLLEACKTLVWQHDNHGALCGMALQDARAAIAKAESR